MPTPSPPSRRQHTEPDAARLEADLELDAADDYFISADGSGCGSTIRLTDIYGERLTINGIAVRPNVVQPTQVQFARH
ncbi:hypothetical protein ACIPSA_29605 [Streptomyces sp. NPDC086549]|uniref:hypothetical protein n=1 Tax=Streptomyces sp. NPDC086549 TaxID=3365752 RepID=UPI0037FF6AB8